MRMIAGLLLAGAVLSACESTDPALTDDPAYQQGYLDGCASAGNQGTIAAGAQRDPKLKGVRAYDAGWSAGYGSCGGSIGGRGDPLGDGTVR
ncbi:MAG: hypothetical protein GC199_06730 [Alphaproteobacteria bacterium]|nr:hypothetical protein [Alphaproteobacteria bacterium]